MSRGLLVWITMGAQSLKLPVPHAAFSFSVYAMFLVLFPFAAPAIKFIAHHFPDKGLLRVRQGRQVVIDIVKRLMADRRLEIENEQASLRLPSQLTFCLSCLCLTF